MSLPSPNAVAVRDLGKRYRSHGTERWAIRQVDLTVPQGSVCGLLGRNGAGKSTMLKMLVGLARPDEGTIEVLGQRCPDGLPSVASRIGAQIDGVGLDPVLSARRNLEVLARLRGIPRGRVDEVLEMLGLASRADDRPSSYSTGMRRRLGLAAALLGEPELLILDEPANGLDPAGIAGLRELMLTLNAQRGTTVVLSSHQLAEVAVLCDVVAILHRGRLLAVGEPSALADEGSAADLESLFLELTDD